ncbi:hypothetical protein [Geomonas anaerohicana]|uniref:Uncharacterized protein n=1 Tax=Geomonas anaerohicana TaxID=2798583 RepID=A0ABS0YA04_9BACT|nr:hypothetical protein [Geomonas anaerohicana]MBJ6749133.1 hypothetical protein [Geomonas anaerohicana]
MKTIMLFLGKLLLFSLLALPMVEWFDRAYQSILQLGVADTGDIPFMSAHLLYLFFVLVLATPRLGLRRRVIGIAIGLLLYLLIDRLMISVWKALPYTQKPGPVPAKEFYTNVYYMVMHWMLPFLLWIVIAYRQIEVMCNRQIQSQTVRGVET